jgi:nicotinamidase-related amidase
MRRISDMSTRDQTDPCTPHPRPRLGWVVDVQHDFMVPPQRGGRLYVHDLADPGDAGATKIERALARTVAWMSAHCDALVYTGDWHADDDREIDRASPNFRDTYPAHCMGAGADPAERPGAELIPAVAPHGALAVVDREATPADADRAARAAAAGTPVMIRKREFSVFAGQAQTDRFLATLAEALGGRPEIIVCGVATDVCVKGAVEGFLDRGHAVTVVRDAVWGLGLVPDAELFAGWERRGARIAPLAELAAERAVAGASARGA